MNVLVCWKWVAPDDDDRWAGVSAADEAALEVGAHSWRGDAGADASVTVATVGPPAAEAALRGAVARGADRAVRVDSPRDLRSDAVAGALAPLAAGCTWVLCGDYSLDRGSGSVPALIAAHRDDRPGARSRRRRPRWRWAAPRACAGSTVVAGRSCRCRRRPSCRSKDRSPGSGARHSPPSSRRARRRIEVVAGPSRSAGDADRGGSIPAPGPRAPRSDRHRRAHPDPRPAGVWMRLSSTATPSPSTHRKRRPGSSNRCASGVTCPPPRPPCGRPLNRNIESEDRMANATQRDVSQALNDVRA